MKVELLEGYLGAAAGVQQLALAADQLLLEGEQLPGLGDQLVLITSGR